MKRSKHSLSHYKLATFDMGELIPVGWFEALPGDTIQQATSALLRVSPLLAPVMHPVSVRIHHWFVPNRLLWSGWEDFITGGPDGNNTALPPMFTTGVGNNEPGKIPDYLGIAPQSTGVEASLLPIHAYNLIVNEFYRDEDLVPERNPTDLDPFRIAWEKDYLTAARPWPQKGPDITMPLGTTAPVTVNDVYGLTTLASIGNTGQSGTNRTLTANPGNATDQLVELRGTADLSNASAVNVNDVRKAFALQRWAEARAQYGSRYTEYLRYLGIRSSDARLQRPEYLGGGKQTIAFSEVLRTGSESAADVIGQMYGHGISAMRSRRYRRFFEEHGIVMSLMSVRPRTMYVQGLYRGWSRRTREDYWQRELELIGQQEVLNKEVYIDHTTPNGVFGYQDRYSDYRHLPSNVCGDFRSTLDFWHMGRIFAADPVLNASFVNCDPSKRINAEQTEDALWVMINHNVQARRMLGKSTIGRIL